MPDKEVVFSCVMRNKVVKLGLMYRICILGEFDEKVYQFA